MNNLPTGVEKHAQAILDRHKAGFVEGEKTAYCGGCVGMYAWPCKNWQDATAVLVAAREHDTRQAEAITLLERILDACENDDPKCGPDDPYCQLCDAHAAAVAALRLLREKD